MSQQQIVLLIIFELRDLGISAIVFKVIARTYVDYFPLMFSLLLEDSEACGNNRRHENNFYHCGVGKITKEKYMQNYRTL